MAQLNGGCAEELTFKKNQKHQKHIEKD